MIWLYELILGFVVRQAVKTLACDVCHTSLLKDAVSALKDKLPPAVP